MKPVYVFNIFIISLLTSINCLFSQINIDFKNITGERIHYFSPYHEFASEALLTRANGNSPIQWDVQQYQSEGDVCEFRFLIGHSTGTSGGCRNFDWSLNGQTIFTFRTAPKQKGKDQQMVNPSVGLSYSFEVLEYDINQDVFGWLTISLPAEWVKKEARFEVKGQNHQSRDWLMLFPYQLQFDAIAQSTALTLRKEQKRPINIALVIPGETSDISIHSAHFTQRAILPPGYHLLSFPGYSNDFHGQDTIQFLLNGVPLLEKVVTVEPSKHFVFHVIHHSHNDIGYSHHQTEVAKIQTENIRKAMRWAQREPQAIWHIESLWAVENFLNECNVHEEELFFDLVKKGNLILSANYANVLSGLCHPNELAWIVEYAQFLKKKYNIQIQNAMITDIPGITYQGLKNYTLHDIPFLALGPNYVDSHVDKGDRVGSVIEKTGDTWLYWTPKEQLDKKILVGTAGKGYSYFHNIQEKEKQFKWENKISQYVTELSAQDNAITDIQLRYTKNADNGPVDTTLVQWINDWNKKFSSPQLVLQSVNQLFSLIDQKYGHQIPKVSGEVSPYWEDGAYSTAKEEIEMRQLVKEIIDLEEHLSVEEKSSSNLYPLHRNVVLFHEHTWGSWCSISDPYSAFTRGQWMYKKAFLDSAQKQMAILRKKYRASPTLSPPVLSDYTANSPMLMDFQIDTLSGGIANLLLRNGKSISFDQSPFWKGHYQYNINPSQIISPYCTAHHRTETKEQHKEMVTIEYPSPSSIDKIFIEYHLNKENGKLDITSTVIKEPILTKESLHFGLGLPEKPKSLLYGKAKLDYTQDQLPGSNKEFICTDSSITVEYEDYYLIIESPDINLFEIGTIIDENQINGAKVWKREPQELDQLFLYVFNNYWHTNYKAEQGGEPIRWKLTLQFIPK